MEPTPGGQLADVFEGLSDPLFTIVARLAKGPRGAPDATVVLADLVEADFVGYAPITLTADLENAWEEDGYGELSPQLLQFNVGAIEAAQQLTHLYFTKTYDGGDPSLVSVIPFNVPFFISEPDTTFELECTVAGVVSPDA
jgi:hypothetical protein